MILVLQKLAEQGVSPSDIGRELSGSMVKAGTPVTALGLFGLGGAGLTADILRESAKWVVDHVGHAGDLAVGLPLAAGVGAGTLGGIGLYHLGRDPKAWEAEIDKLKYDRVRNEYRQAIRKLKRRKKSPIDGISLEFNQ